MNLFTEIEFLDTSNKYNYVFNKYMKEKTLFKNIIIALISFSFIITMISVILKLNNVNQDIVNNIAIISAYAIVLITFISIIFTLKYIKWNEISFKINKLKNDTKNDFIVIKNKEGYILYVKDVDTQIYLTSFRKKENKKSDKFIIDLNANAYYVPQKRI